MRGLGRTFSGVAVNVLMWMNSINSKSRKYFSQPLLSSSYCKNINYNKRIVWIPTVVSNCWIIQPS